MCIDDNKLISNELKEIKIANKCIECKEADVADGFNFCDGCLFMMSFNDKDRLKQIMLETMVDFIGYNDDFIESNPNLDPHALKLVTSNNQRIKQINKFIEYL